MFDLVPLYEDSNFYSLAEEFCVHDGGIALENIDIQPIPGYVDFLIHSNGYEFTLTDDQTKELYSAQGVAYLIRETDSWDGFTPIRLISCYAGLYDDGAAQMLADELGVEIMAPICEIAVYDDGLYMLHDATIEDARYKWDIWDLKSHADNGEDFWRRFYPGGYFG